jgi:hypothetical protein
LIDDLVLSGSPELVATGLTAHLEAGADQVVVQLLTEDDADLAAGYARLAPALDAMS